MAPQIFWLSHCPVWKSEKRRKYMWITLNLQEIHVLCCTTDLAGWLCEGKMICSKIFYITDSCKKRKEDPMFPQSLLLLRHLAYLTLNTWRYVRRLPNDVNDQTVLTFISLGWLYLISGNCLQRYNSPMESGLILRNNNCFHEWSGSTPLALDCNAVHVNNCSNYRSVFQM